MGARETPPAGELILPPPASWAPVLLAIGIAVALAGSFAGWVYAAIGGLVALIALWRWISSARRELSSLPREQPLTTAVLPAVAVKRARRD